MQPQLVESVNAVQKQVTNCLDQNRKSKLRCFFCQSRDDKKGEYQNKWILEEKGINNPFCPGGGDIFEASSF